MLLAVALCFPNQNYAAAASYSEVIHSHLALETSTPPPLVNHPAVITAEATAEAARRINLRDAVENEAQHLLRAQDTDSPSARPPRPPNNALVILAVVAVPFIGFLACWVKRQRTRMFPIRDWYEEKSRSLLLEDPAMAEFFRELRHRLHPELDAPATPASIEANPAAGGKKSEAARFSLREFRASAARHIADLRKLLSELNRNPDAAGQKEMLEQCHRLIIEFKDRAKSPPPQLQPFGLVTSVMEGLVKQILRNSADFTPSVRGAVAEAVDLLEAMCRQRVAANIATKPPVKLLAVDDDPISRMAISFALKKAFDAPDLAPDGVSALGLVEQNTYDVIFLDVDMPGMDGYELCTRIRKTGKNQATPVIFVTRHGDFNSRAQAKLSGGEGLIAKPYHAFELTLKALTAILRARLKRGKTATPQHAQPVLPAGSKSESVTPATAPDPLTAPSANVPVSPIAEPPITPARNHGDLATSSPLTEFILRDLLKNVGENTPQAFSRQIPVVLQHLRWRVQAVRDAGESNNIPKLLGELHLEVKSLCIAAERAELRLVGRLSSTLEAALNHAQKASSDGLPALLAATDAASDLLEELYDRTAPAPDLNQPPVRILVVDDDPVARRALAMAVQLVFGRPEFAGSGEAALVCATEHAYDLILLDVMMPGLDGFATCTRLRETVLNRDTPVVFVTSMDTPTTRDQATASGGNGFLPKPASPSLLKLLALTFIIRARAKTHKSSRSLEAAECMATAQP